MKDKLIQNKWLILLGVFTTMISMTTLFLFADESKTLSSPTVMQNWHLAGTKSISELSNLVSPKILSDKNMLRVTYNLHGLCVLDGNASSLSFIDKETKKKYSVSLSDYGKNCTDGLQTIDIPLSHFEFPKDARVESVIASFWYPTQYEVDIQSAILFKSDTVVLGESTKKENVKKTFPNITPIRQFPYAKTSQ